ncbi:hypothetical protein EJMLMN_EJMLMN_17290, partial [Dysosmobacter welbionis]
VSMLSSAPGQSGVRCVSRGFRASGLLISPPPVNRIAIPMRMAAKK